MCLRYVCKPFQLFLKRCLNLNSVTNRLFSSNYNRTCSLRCTSFIVGFSLAQAYHYYLLKKIPFPYKIGTYLSLFISLLLGIGNSISTQVRCICLLILPMYCGKPGRGVLKAVLLTYVVAGPITNMGLNAREVVRVFACSTRLSYNLSKQKYDIISEPIRKSAISLQTEIDQLKDTISPVGDIAVPIEREIEDSQETELKQKENDYLDTKFGYGTPTKDIESKLKTMPKDITAYETLYRRKLEYRCEHQFTQAVATCLSLFADSYDACYVAVPHGIAQMVCWPLKLGYICNIMPIIRSNDSCLNDKQTISGIGTGYAAYKSAKHEITKNLRDIRLQYKIVYETDLYDVQDAKETGERVIHEFEEKHIIMEVLINTLNVCMALMFLRIVVAAAAYHDMYLTIIEHDNIYITTFFKLLDERRAARGEITLLPLKKMERRKYIDVYSMAYKGTDHGKRLTQLLKLMLEVVTATTFVMLDRLFYEALDVVRQHAQIDTSRSDGLDVDVEGTGMLASLFRKLFANLASVRPSNQTTTNKECLPRPRGMPPLYFLKIYGGYVWILILLCINPYTLRLNRLICSYFYPFREKQRILHLYNDILKKRLKMPKTLKRKAIQAARAHFLSGENLLSLRMKFPHIFGWTRVLPMARMTCLICGETEPRNMASNQLSEERWYSCATAKCPFVFCNECWMESGATCLACDPSLVDMSDIDSLSEDEKPRY